MTPLIQEHWIFSSLAAQLETIYCWTQTTISSPLSTPVAMLVSSKLNSDGCWPEPRPSALKLWPRPRLVLKNTESTSVLSNQQNNNNSNNNNNNNFITNVNVP